MMPLPIEAFIVVPRAVALLAVALVTSCSLCSETPVSEVISSSGKHAVVLVRDCGATTDFATVVQAGGFFRSDVIAVNGKEELVASWSPDGTVLTVRVPKALSETKIFVKESKLSGVRVVVERE